MYLFNRMDEPEIEHVKIEERVPYKLQVCVWCNEEYRGFKHGAYCSYECSQKMMIEAQHGANE
jgi:hypothetical protein